jgi:hypothetical protein
MAKNKSPRVVAPALFDLEPESPKQEAPAPSSPKDADQFVDMFMYALTAPYITWPGYQDIYQANDNKNKALVYRLAHLQELFARKECSELEAMLYMSTATLVHPPSHDWFNIYMWLFRRWATPEQAADVGDDLPEKLSPSQSEDLARLRRWIFKQQMDHIRRKTRPPAEGPPPPAGEPELVQLSFFQEGSETK